MCEQMKDKLQEQVEAASRHRHLKGFECAANGGLHGFSDAVETLTEASRCAADVPAEETKGDVFG